MSAFLSSLLSLLSTGKPRWIAVDGVADEMTREIEVGLTDYLGESPVWLLPEDGQLPDVRHGFVAAGSPWVLVDILDGFELPAVKRQLKTLLKALPKARFIFLAGESLQRLELPSYLGEGAHLSLEAGRSLHFDDTRLLHHARRLAPKYGTKDLVLGPKALLKFQEALDYIRTKDFCLEQWGFRRRHSRGHGVTLLFHGESGTGKTMAAEVVAKTLDLPLYQVDLSSVVSKWVGETEKNLKSIFKSATGIPGILLFDEGDAIFGQRTKVEASQDRYSNLEVNHLLQEIESFDGIVILSTNHEKDMDAAFLRRFTYSITFGRPDANQRLQIWRANTPSELPLGSTVNFAKLSAFSLTGGNIRNCIRDGAARAAAQDSALVEQVDFLWAIKRELQKHGLALDRELVGEEYWRLVAPEWEHKRNSPSIHQVSNG